MLKTNNNPIYAGVIAGLATVFLICFSQFLLPLTPFVTVPIFLIAFAYGTYSNFVAGLTAIIGMTILCFSINRVISFEFNFLLYGFYIYSFFYFIPASLFAWLYNKENKNYNARQKSTELNNSNYFSLATIFNYMVLYFAVISTLSCLILLDNPIVQQLITLGIQLFSEMLRTAEPNNASVIEQTIAQIQSVDTFYWLILFCSFTGIVCFLITFTGLYIGSRVATQKKWIIRKKENWPRELRLPKSAVFVFVIVFLLSYIRMNTTLLVVPIIFTLILMVAFTISGLAFVHYKTKNLTYRLPLLIGIYICLFSLILSQLVSIGLIICGIIATFHSISKSIYTQ